MKISQMTRMQLCLLMILSTGGYLRASSMYFIDIDHSMKRKIENGLNQLSLIVNVVDGRNVLEIGKYDTFRTLVEDQPRNLSSFSGDAQDEEDQLSQMQCECAFKRVFVVIGDEDVEEIRKYKEILDPNRKIQTGLPKGDLAKVKKILHSRIEHVLEQAKTPKEVEDQVRRIKALLSDPSMLKQILLEESRAGEDSASVKQQKKKEKTSVNENSGSSTSSGGDRLIPASPSTPPPSQSPQAQTLLPSNPLQSPPSEKLLAAAPPRYFSYQPQGQLPLTAPHPYFYYPAPGGSPPQPQQLLYYSAGVPPASPYPLYYYAQPA